MLHYIKCIGQSVNETAIQRMKEPTKQPVNEDYTLTQTNVHQILCHIIYVKFLRVLELLEFP